MKMSQIVVGSYAHYRYSFDYFLDLMDRLPVKNIELWAAGPHLYFDDYTYPMIRDFYAGIKARGLHVVCVTPEQCMYPINIGSDDPIMRDRSIRYFKKAIDTAEIMEAPKALVTVGQHLVDHDRDTAFRLTAEALAELADYAAPKGVMVVLEHLTRGCSCVAVTAKEVKDVLDAVGPRPNLKPMIDTDMAARIDESPKDYLEVFGKELSHVHFIDGMPGGHLVPGDGVLPMARYLEELDAAGYQNHISLEVMNAQYYLDPNPAIERSIRFFEEYLANH
ncbi:MAG: sugar phosphate isomerase/epimerase family protein [Oscillospiraceae bacterium]|nr:sugar phosphate isomerase/epimerase [Oscillospiraceae bacterium]MDY4191247.1 sugar phosphate isomerase/epimerase family protein [Oscillospiraceae bacterium]